MNNMIKKQGLLVFFVVSALIFGFSLTAEAYNTWDNYKWNITATESKLNPIKLGNNFTKNSSWDGFLLKASSDWNQSVLKNQIVRGGDNKKQFGCDMVLGKVEICNDKYGTAGGWLGLAAVNFTKINGIDYIYAATVQLNDDYFNAPEYIDNLPLKQSVLCQEIGHTFGLDHQDENWYNANLGTCMDYSNDPSGAFPGYGPLNNEHPNQMDYATLAYLYDDTNSNGCPAGFSPIDDYYFNQVDCWAQCNGNLPAGVLVHTKFAGYYPEDPAFLGNNITSWTYKVVADDYKLIQSDLDNELTGCEFTCPVGQEWNGTSCGDSATVNSTSIIPNPSVSNYSVSEITNKILNRQNSDATHNLTDLKSNKEIKKLDMTDRKNWGKAIKKDQKGRDSVFVNQIAENEYITTYVIWAE